MANLFINNFKTPYFEFKIGSTTQHFTNLVVVAERIGQAIEVGIVNSEVIRNPSWGMVIKLGILFDRISLCHQLLKVIVKDRYIITTQRYLPTSLEH
jgi:hypothetical protein